MAITKTRFRDISRAELIALHGEAMQNWEELRGREVQIFATPIRSDDPRVLWQDKPCSELFWLSVNGLSRDSSGNYFRTVLCAHELEID